LARHLNKETRSNVVADKDLFSLDQIVPSRAADRNRERRSRTVDAARLRRPSEKATRAMPLSIAVLIAESIRAIAFVLYEGTDGAMPHTCSIINRAANPRQDGASLLER
jgi:hypothetical protein